MARKKFLAIRVSDEEKEFIKRLAKDKKMNITQLMIALIYRFGQNL